MLNFKSELCGVRSYVKNKKKIINLFDWEIGINHNGSVKIAKKLIDLAKYSNFDA